MSDNDAALERMLTDGGGVVCAQKARLRTPADGVKLVDTEEVTGSNPVSPTIDIQPLTSGNAGQGLRRSVAEVTASCLVLD